MEDDGGSHLLRAELADYRQASNLSMNDRIRGLIKNGAKIHHLGFGQSPFPVPEKLVEALQRNAHRNEYLSIAGIEELRRAICEFHKRFDTGIPPEMMSPDQLVVGDGSKMLIFLIMAITDAEIWLKSPSWTTYRPQAALAGSKKTVLVSSRGQEIEWKITPDSVEKALSNSTSTNRILIFTHPCNPTGTLYTEAELSELAACFRKHAIIAICDEIYSHLTFSGRFVSLSKFYPEGCIVTTGLSKWASAGGWRFGYAFFPRQLSRIQSAVTSAASHTYSCCAAPQQYAIAEFLCDFDAAEDFMFHTRRILHRVSDMCTSKLSAAGVKVTPAHAGYYIFPDFEVLRSGLNKRGITTGQQMCDAILDEANIALLPGGPQHLRDDSELTVRLCFVNFDGAEALKASRKVGTEKPLPEDFLSNYCQQTVEAIDGLVAWCKKQMDE